MNEETNLEARSTLSDEFAWRAFRYLHGELTTEEVEAFEEDLAVEQRAREALAQAVELTAALEASGHVGESLRDSQSRLEEARLGETRPRGRWSRRQMLAGAGIAGAAIAACLAVIVTLGVMGRFGRNDPSGPAPTDPGNAQAALAEAWAGIGGEEWRNNPWQDVAGAPPIPFSHDADVHDAGVVDEDRLPPDHEVELSVPTVPSWLLVALDPRPDHTPEIENIQEIKQ